MGLAVGRFFRPPGWYRPVLAKPYTSMCCLDRMEPRRLEAWSCRSFRPVRSSCDLVRWVRRVICQYNGDSVVSRELRSQNLRWLLRRSLLS